MKSTKNLRSKMTNMMMERVYNRSQSGQAMEEILMDIAQDGKAPLELRFKAASRVADLVFPRAASVEVDMEVTETLNPAQMDARIAELLSLAKPKEV